MKQIKKALRMHRIFVTQEMKRMMEYKGDFIVGIIGFLLGQFFNLMFIWIIFSQIPSLMGWTLEQIVFIYGFSLIPKGIDHLLFDNLWSIGHFTVRKGDFDKYLTRPINTGIKTATAAIAFWTKRSGNITYMFYMVNDFAKYPITIYNNIVRNIITYIIPFAFTAFYPAYYILSGENPLFNIGMTVLIAIVMMVVGVIVWNRGIRSYESAGS